MAVALTAFQQTVMNDVVRKHAEATTHDAYCCETVARYQAQLAACTVQAQKVPAPRSTSSRLAKPASEKQVKFIQVLLDKKIVTPAERATDLEGLSSADAHDMIDRLLKREDDIEGQKIRKVERSGRPASEKQVGYIQSLAAQRDWPQEGPIADIIRAVLAEEVVGATEASQAIERLLSCPKAKKPEVGEEGIYFFEGEFYKVQRAFHGSGRLYSKKFDRETESWSRGGSLSKLTEEYKLTAEQAKEFGDLYGCCIRCMATLTDEISIERGVGPICAEKMGF